MMKKSILTILMTCVILSVTGCSGEDYVNELKNELEESSNVEELDENIVSNICGIYECTAINETGKILVLSPDGTLEYYDKSSDYKDDSVWKLVRDNELRWKSNLYSGWIYANLGDDITDDIRRIYFSSKDAYWDEMEFSKISVTPKQFTKKQLKKLLYARLTSEELQGYDYKTVKKLLKKERFTNIKIKKKKIKSSDILDGEVKSVKIDGSTDYDSYMNFKDKSVKVVITYYKVKYQEEDKSDTFAGRYEKYSGGKKLKLESEYRPSSDYSRERYETKYSYIYFEHTVYESDYRTHNWYYVKNKGVDDKAFKKDLSYILRSYHDWSKKRTDKEMKKLEKAGEFDGYGVRTNRFTLRQD